MTSATPDSNQTDRVKTQRLRVAIAGASGFVGRALVANLQSAFHVIRLGRHPVEPAASDAVETRKCDLFSLRDAEQALEGVDVAIYLVHSMMPTTRLAQGNFEDFDLVCADNFARAAKSAGIERIIYLGGLVPQSHGVELSQHLRSRKEVEDTLASRGVPVTTLRAGLVVGAGGSSHRMLTKLVGRLPVMICPKWTASRTQPIALEDVVALLAYCVNADDVKGKCYDVGSPDVLSYTDMMRETAELMGKSLRVIHVPFFTPRLSLWWVRLVTGTPMSLVAPLVQSLRHDMVATDAGALAARAGLVRTSFRVAMANALRTEKLQAQRKSGKAAPSTGDNDGTVKSVQRLVLPRQWDAVRVADEYMSWLPTFFRTAIKVDVCAGVCSFRLGWLKRPLLELTFVPNRSSVDRHLFLITGGMLARVDTPTSQRGRLEFRLVPGQEQVIAAIHDFVPSLPWIVYVATQALAHLFVMRAFGRHLQAIRDKAI